MNFKNMYSYNINDNKRSLTIFYGIIIAIYLLFLSTNFLFDGNSSIGGMEMSSAIFIFVLGLNSFKSNFHFGLANGVSRKTQFLSYAASAVTLAVIMAIMDIVIANIVTLIISPKTLYLQLYGQRYSSFATQLTFINHVQMIIEGFIWYTFLYSMTAMLGYCITLIYYRSNLIIKWIVSLIPFLLMFVVLPYLDNITQGAIGRFIGDFIPWALGFLEQGVNPYIAVMNFFLGYILFGAVSYLLIRRATIRQ